GGKDVATRHGRGEPAPGRLGCHARLRGGRGGVQPARCAHQTRGLGERAPALCRCPGGRGDPHGRQGHRGCAVGGELLMARHVVRYAAEASYLPAPSRSSAADFSRWTIADEHTSGAVHTEFNVCQLESGGVVTTAVQSFEECFYVLSGNPILQTPDG